MLFRSSIANTSHGGSLLSSVFLDEAHSCGVVADVYFRSSILQAGDKRVTGSESSEGADNTHDDNISDLNFFRKGPSHSGVNCRSPGLGNDIGVGLRNDGIFYVDSVSLVDLLYGLCRVNRVHSSDVSRSRNY